MRLLFSSHSELKRQHFQKAVVGALMINAVLQTSPLSKHTILRHVVSTKQEI